MITIRKATVTDVVAITRLNQALFDYEEQFGHEYNLDWPNSAIGQAYFMKSIQDDNSVAFVAEYDGQVIGYVLGTISSFAYRRINPICEIDNMYVEEGFRSQGIGKRLLTAVKKAARQEGAKRLRVGAIAQNTKAIMFYKGNGFGPMNTYLETKL